MHMKRAPKQFANLGFHLLETKSLVDLCAFRPFTRESRPDQLFRAFGAPDYHVTIFVDQTFLGLSLQPHDLFPI